MIFATLLLLATADVDPTDPADWTCADNLIEKNYSAKFPAGKLAARIVDECAREFDEKADPLWEESRADLAAAKAMHAANKVLFLIKIEEKIEKRRFADEVPLKR